MAEHGETAIDGWKSSWPSQEEKNEEERNDSRHPWRTPEGWRVSSSVAKADSMERCHTETLAHNETKDFKKQTKQTQQTIDRRADQTTDRRTDQPMAGA